MAVDITTWAKSITERLNEKTKHVYDMVDQKLEYQHKYLEQRLDSLHAVQSEKLLNFSVRLEEALAEIRGYKDILQQQLTVVDSATKRAHERLDEFNAKSKESQGEIAHSIEKSAEQVAQLANTCNEKVVALELAVKAAQQAIDKLEQTELIETSQKQALRNDPIRKFFNENAQKILLFVLAGIGLYLLRNFGDVISSFGR